MTKTTIPSEGGAAAGSTIGPDSTLALQPPRDPSKLAALAALLLRTEGATLDEMTATTGWLSHTTRAAITRLKSRDYIITSDKIDSVRTYHATRRVTS